MIDLSVLTPAEDERPGQAPQALGRDLVAASFHRLREALLEAGGRAEESRVGELHDGPQIRQPVLDRRASDGDPVAGRQGPHGRRLPGRRVLDGLRLVHHDPVPLDLRQIGRVPRREGVGRDDEVGLADRRREVLAAGPFGSVMDVDPQARRELRHLALPVADERHRTDQQGRTDVGRRPDGRPMPVWSPSRRASTVADLPRPMSSARIRPSPSDSRKVSQARPRSWYGRRVPVKPSGAGTGSSRRSTWPDRRSPSSPSAATDTTGRPPGPSSVDSPAWSRSPTVI